MNCISQSYRLPNKASYVVRDQAQKASVLSTAEKQTIKVMVEQIVANVFGVSVKQINSTSRNRAPVAFARQTAMYLSHVVCGLNFSEVGALFHRDRTTVSHACKCVEDHRDDMAFDQGMEFLETATALFVGRIKSLNGGAPHE